MNFKDLFHKNPKPQNIKHPAHKGGTNDAYYNGNHEDFDTSIVSSYGMPDSTADSATDRGDASFKDKISGSEQRKLKRGKISIGARCDLHGYTRAQALPIVVDFIQQAQQRNIRYVLIIFGKGKLSEGKKPVIKPMVLSYLQQSPEVVAYTTAHARDGGSGAAYVVIRSHRRNG